jgi:hypothetical protein
MPSLITDMETKPHYQKTTPRKGYIYSKANWNKVKEPTIPGKRKLFSSLDENIPSKTIKSNNNLPWINHKVRKTIKRKQRFYNQAKKTKKWNNYRQCQKECKKTNEE